ncbi:MAG: transglycosylase domain-containing protein, partial [Candidatus Limnocylindria bacterium]
MAFATFFFVPLPTVVPTELPQAVAQTSHIYAADGKTRIASFHAEHNRELISLNEMPVHLVAAAVAAEDKRFFTHAGIDIKAITRALI